MAEPPERKSRNDFFRQIHYIENHVDWQLLFWFCGKIFWNSNEKRTSALTETEILFA